MRSKWMVILFSCACGGATAQTAAEPVATVTLPTVTPPPPPPPPPAPISNDERRPGDYTLTVSFAEVRKHPDAARLDAVIRSAPAWRAFPSIDPVRDLDWLVQHGDDMLVRHATPDAAVNTAIAAIAQPITVQSPNVKAWRGVVNHLDAVFLRAQPQVVRIARADHVDEAVRDLVAHATVAPSFHANEALRARMPWPGLTFPQVPSDLSDARLWIDSRIADGGADIYAEADCPSADAARADAATLAALIRQKNTLGVRLMSGGLLNNVEVTTVDKQVHMHLSASQQQIESTISVVSSVYGRANQP